MIKKTKKNVEDISNECGFSIDMNKDIEKLLSSSIAREPACELDEKIKNHAKRNKSKSTTFPLFFKFGIPFAAAALLLFVFVLDFQTKITDKSNLENQYSLTENELFGIDVELATLDLEIDLVENEMQDTDSFLTYPNKETKNNIDSLNSTKSSLKLYNKLDNTV
jgi:hypothetical protein